ncbi:hypothetical protein [Occallatibacter riparius]|uniref:RHS repeat protein n=1 Tax=Occallatibacter riparius TaxID=1002689 RepID=A0A9J7BXU7_9BACT|nr:hypothetical protein [Occallatibacter riparius]UWZ86826.1 hypothetical protein MOP44_12960 [Occallatibacter riparius]
MDTSPPVAGYSYQRGPTGNLANVVELNGRTVNWTYDGINRLTSESITSDPSKNNGSVSYGLDPVGNRTSASSSLNAVPSGNWSFNADDEVSSESYDANGNVIPFGRQGRPKILPTFVTAITYTASPTSYYQRAFQKGRE